MASAAVVAEVAARIIRALYARTGNGKIAELGATEPCQVTLWPRRDSISFFPKWKEEKHEEEVNKEEHQFNLTVIHFITVRKLTQNWRQIQSFINCNGNSSLVLSLQNSRRRRVCTITKADGWVAWNQRRRHQENAINYNDVIVR